MANLLDNYNENLPCEEAVSSNENVDATKWFRKKERKVLKAIRKMVKRQNKLLKEELNRKKAEREAAGGADMYACAQAAGSLTIALGGDKPTCDIPITIVLFD